MLIGADLLVYLGFGADLMGVLATNKDKAMILAILGFIFAGIGWSGKEFITQGRNHTKLRVLELLSDGQPRSEQEITKTLERRSIMFRIFEPQDALADFVLSGMITVADGKYKINLPHGNQTPTKAVTQKRTSLLSIGYKWHISPIAEIAEIVEKAFRVPVETIDANMAVNVLSPL